MALTINAVDERGPSNELHCQLQPVKAKVTLYSSKWHFTHCIMQTRRIALVLTVDVSYKCR